MPPCYVEAVAERTEIAPNVANEVGRGLGELEESWVLQTRGTAFVNTHEEPQGCGI